MNNQFDYTIIEMIESAVRNMKLQPLILNGPPAGIIGQLAQTNVIYDTFEDASSGFISESGMSLLDNLNHIRYRIQVAESELSSTGFAIYHDGIIVTSGITIIDFAGDLGVTDLGSGHVIISGSASETGAITFLDLTDTPVSYAGSAGMSLVVNSTEDGVEFVTISGGVATLGDSYSVVLTDSIGSIITLPWIGYDETTQSIEFGKGVVGKEANAGKIGYKSFDSEGLDIIGAGDTPGNRVVNIYDNLNVTGTLGLTAVNLPLGETYNVDGSPHSHTYLDLSDTPDTYSGHALQIPSVRIDETGLEWADNTQGHIIKGPDGLSVDQAPWLQFDGSVTVATDGSITHVTVSDESTAVTIDANADTVLSLIGQELGLDTQEAHKVLIGRVDAGADLIPTFRMLDAADIPAALSNLPNGTAQYQILTTNATPFAPVYSSYLLDGTAGGKTNLAVTSGKTLTLTAADNYNLTVPATGTAALLGTVNQFTAQQFITNTGTPSGAGYATLSVTANYSYAGSSYATQIGQYNVLNTGTDAYNHSGWTGLGSIVNVQQTGGIIGAVAGINGGVYIASTSSAAITEVYGLVFSVQQSGNGNVGTMFGATIQTLLLTLSAANVTLFGGYKSSLTHQGSGLISTGANFYGKTLAGTGSVTNWYGLYLENQGRTNIANAYGIYLASQSGAGTLNYAIYTNAGLVHFGDSIDISATKTISLSGQIISSLATGTAPLSVVSTTMTANLNADLLDGHHASFFLTTTSLITEIPTGTINGVNKDFFVSVPFIAGALVYKNGLRQTIGDDYTESPTLGKITFTDAPSNVSFDDKLLVTFVTA